MSLEERGAEKMSAVSRLADGLKSLATWHAKPLPEPEPVYGAPRAPTGLFNSLSVERQKAVLRFNGPQDHGDPDFYRDGAR